MTSEIETATIILSKPWQKFFAKFSEIDNLKNSKWQDIHQLAYIVKRYEQFFNRKFAFSFKGAPSRCTEIALVKKIGYMLNTTNARVITEYINWVYDKKIIPKNIKIKNISFFLTAGLGNEFLIYRAENNKIKKTTELPNDYKEIILKLDLPIYNYGDLSFAKNILDERGETNSPALIPYKELFNNLLAIGFDFAILKDIV